MHENRNLFLFLIEINNMHRTRHIYQYPGPVFGAGAAGAVFHNIEWRLTGATVFFSVDLTCRYWYLILDDDERVACALDAHIRPVLVQSILEAIHWWSFSHVLWQSVPVTDISCAVILSLVL